MSQDFLLCERIKYIVTYSECSYRAVRGIKTNCPMSAFEWRGEKKSVKDLFHSDLPQLSSIVQGIHHSRCTIGSSYISSTPVRNLKWNCLKRCYRLCKEWIICKTLQSIWGLGRSSNWLQMKLQGKAGTLRQLNHTMQDKTERKQNIFI